LITNNQIIAALDTKPMIGRGAALDTYNLLAQGMRQLARALARENQSSSISEYLKGHGLERLDAPSVKGTESLDWSDDAARDAFLTILVADARRLLQLADGANAHVRKNAELLGQLILQDVAEGGKDNGTDNSTRTNPLGHGAGPTARKKEQKQALHGP
jgi:hypothetical protein